MQSNLNLKLRHIAILSFWVVLMNLCGGALFFMKLIPLTVKHKNSENHRKFFAKVSDEDYDFLMQWNWCAVYSTKNTFYAMRGIRNKHTGRTISVRMHRLILGITDPKILVDHRDHDGLNNQRDNIRVATRQQNNFNIRPYGASKYIGVGLHHNKWRGRVKVDGKTISTAQFDNEEDAAKARDVIAKKLHGEFANLNFPNES